MNRSMWTCRRSKLLSIHTLWRKIEHWIEKTERFSWSLMTTSSERNRHSLVNTDSIKSERVRSCDFECRPWWKKRSSSLVRTRRRRWSSSLKEFDWKRTTLTSSLRNRAMKQVNKKWKNRVSRWYLMNE